MSDLESIIDKLHGLNDPELETLLCVANALADKRGVPQALRRPPTFYPGPVMADSENRVGIAARRIQV